MQVANLDLERVHLGQQAAPVGRVLARLQEEVGRQIRQPEARLVDHRQKAVEVFRNKLHICVTDHGRVKTDETSARLKHTGRRRKACAQAEAHAARRGATGASATRPV